jgi:lipopolysaccharide exporter
MDSLFKKIAVGAFWTMFAKLCVKSLGFISTLILARILFPEDFGLVAISMTVVSFLEIFTSFGFDINIIRKKNVTDNTLNSAWTFKLLSGVMICLLIYSSSHYLQEFFQNKNLESLLKAVAFLPILKGLENIGFVLYRKELNFKKEFNLDVIAKVISFLVTISTAFYLKSYWALVFGMYAHALMRVFISYTMHSYRPTVDFSEIKELFSFSKWLLLNNIVIFFNKKVTDLIIAKYSGSSALGYYSIGNEIANLPTTELVFPMSRAVFPGYAKVANDKKELKRIFIKITRLVVYLTAPVCFGIAATADELIPILLGDKWIAVIDIVFILSFFAFLRCSIQSAGSVFIALGKPKVPLVLGLFRIFLLLPLLYFFVIKQGAEGAAIAILITAICMNPIVFYTLNRHIQFSISDILKIFFNPVVSGVTMFCVVMFIPSYFPNIAMIWILMIKILSGLVTFGITTMLITFIWPNSNEIWQLYKKRNINE